MIGFTKAIAKEFARRNVTANVVAPGFVNSDMTAALSDEQRTAASQFIPLGRFGEPAEIAHAVLTLCADEASYITGQVFTVDGGMVM
jgi:3-oxoacyl-[acyl-carrier protein] reductase